MQKTNSLAQSILTFILFSVSGIGLGYLTGLLAASIANDSSFSSWISLESSTKFKSIVDVTSKTIWAQSEDGKLYAWNFICYGNIPCKQWAETLEVPSDAHDFGERPMEKSTSCQTGSVDTIKQPPGNLIECARGRYSGPEYGESVYYALLEDGSLWALNTSSSLIVFYVLPIYFSIGGLVLSIIVFMIQRQRNNKLQVAMDSKPQ
ncbi:MAG TPA: hypothetical protein VN653_12740 [Anaerolineales bacterium]|nr:hypothetical protein [Anaerolineales bacterium]